MWDGLLENWNFLRKAAFLLKEDSQNKGIKLYWIGLTEELLESIYGTWLDIYSTLWRIKCHDVPSNANMKMKRNRRSRSDRMDDMALVKATTRLRREDQYLKYWVSEAELYHHHVEDYFSSYFVTLKTLRSLRALRAEIPKELARGL